MSVTVKDIVTIIENLAPLEFADPDDNNGLLVGDSRQIVNRVMVALDASLEVIHYAIKMKVDMIIAHHPMIYKPLQMINEESLEGSKILLLLKHNIAVYCAHSSLDVAVNGLNDAFGDALGLRNIRSVLELSQMDFLKMGELAVPQTLDQYTDTIKKQLRLPYLHYVGEENRVISRVAFCSGSGMSFLKEAMGSGVDVYVTGDLKYHDAQYVQEMGFSVVDATHFGSETIAKQLFYETLVNYLSDSVEILIDTISQNPIKFK